MKYKIIKKLYPQIRLTKRESHVILSEKDETEQIIKSSYIGWDKSVEKQHKEDLKYTFEKLE